MLSMSLNRQIKANSQDPTVQRIILEEVSNILISFKLPEVLICKGHSDLVHCIDWAQESYEINVTE